MAPSGEHREPEAGIDGSEQMLHTNGLVQYAQRWVVLNQLVAPLCGHAAVEQNDRQSRGLLSKARNTL
jgi:hypothetical protein